MPILRWVKIRELTNSSHEREWSFDSELGAPFVWLSGEACTVLKPLQRIQSRTIFEHEIMLAQEISYRTVAKVLNQIYHRTGKNRFVATSLEYRIESTGKRLSAELQKTAESILQQNGFDAETGICTKDADIPQRAVQPSSAHTNLIDLQQAEAAVDILNRKRSTAEQICAEKAIESKIETSEDNVCYISIDDIGVKSQKQERKPTFKKENVYVENTVIHVQTKDSKYVITAVGMQKAFKILMTYLIENHIMDGHRLVLFTDGANIIKSYIQEYFSFLYDYTIILDWFHLAKRCKELLSMSIKESMEEKHTIRKNLLRILWAGNVEEAKDYLSNLKKKNIKSIGTL